MSVGSFPSASAWPAARPAEAAGLIAISVKAVPRIQSVKTGRPTTSSSAAAVALTRTPSPAVWHAAP